MAEQTKGQLRQSLACDICDLLEKSKASQLDCIHALSMTLITVLIENDIDKHHALTAFGKHWDSMTVRIDEVRKRVRH